MTALFFIIKTLMCLHPTHLGEYSVPNLGLSHPTTYVNTLFGIVLDRKDLPLNQCVECLIIFLFAFCY